MVLDTQWAEMIDCDPQLLVELRALRLERDCPEDIMFVEGMRYVLELLDPLTKERLIQDSFTLFEEDK